jgi:8-oxo-dGTP diphosphatase
MSQPRTPWMLVAIYLLLLREGQVLLLRRRQTGYEDGNYSLIAGHVERDERLITALIREAAEEVGITPEEQDVQFLSVMQRQGADRLVYLDFFFAAGRWEGDVRNCEPAQCDDLRWVPLTALPPNMVPHVRAVLAQHIAQGLQFSEYRWEAPSGNRD